MLDPEEESLEKHVILLLVGELIGVLRLIGLHQVAKFVFGKVLFVSREALHDLDEGSAESSLCLFIILGVCWSFEQVYHKVSCTLNGDLPVSLEMEQEGSEYL
jgi:hypothetical protein